MPLHGPRLLRRQLGLLHKLIDHIAQRLAMGGGRRRRRCRRRLRLPQGSLGLWREGCVLGPG